MKPRRAFLLALGACASAARAADSRRVARIGVLSFGAAAVGPGADPSSGFRQGLRELGYVEGRNLAIEWRYAGGRREALVTLAAELVQRKMDVLLAGGPAPLYALRAATRDIPIVAVAGSDPVAEGWAQSLARPGGNATGFTVTYPELQPKRLQLLKTVLPSLQRVAVLSAPADLPNRTQVRQEIEEAARSLSMQVQFFELRGAQDIKPAFDGAGRWGAQAVSAIATNLVVTERARLAALAIERRLPSASEFPLLAEAGFLLAYGADLEDLGRRCATYVDKILKGARPGELPIERPTKLQLIVNLATARSLGVTVPATFLARADRVIE